MVVWTSSRSVPSEPRSLMFAPSVTSEVHNVGMYILPEKVQALTGLLILFWGVDSNFWLSRNLFFPSQIHTWKAWWVFSMPYLFKGHFQLLSNVPRGLAALQHGCCPLPAEGHSPEAFSSCSLSAVPGLAPVGPISSQSFPSYCCLDSLWLQQLFAFLDLPGLGRGLSFSPAALSLSHPPDIQASATLLYLFLILPVSAAQALLPSLYNHLGHHCLGLAAHSPPFEYRCLSSCAETAPCNSTTWSIPLLHICPQCFVSTESTMERKGSYVLHWKANTLKSNQGYTLHPWLFFNSFQVIKFIFEVYV